MTKTQLKKKIKELIKQSNKSMIKNLDKIINSGAIDLTQYENNYILPKICICALFKEERFQYKPLSNKARKELKNLEYFL